MCGVAIVMLRLWRTRWAGVKAYRGLNTTSDGEFAETVYSAAWSGFFSLHRRPNVAALTGERRLS